MKRRQCRMTSWCASAASCLAAAVSLPAWVIIVGKCIVAFARLDCPAGFALLVAPSVLFAIPFGWIIGYVIAPTIYEGCNLAGRRRYGRAILVHATVAVVVGGAFVVLYLLDGIHPYIDMAVAISVCFSPLLFVPSLIGTFIYAYATSPTVWDACV